MTDLVALVSGNEKGWPHVQRLIREQGWSRIFLVTNDFGKANFKSEKPVKFIVIDDKRPVSDIIESIKAGLAEINDLEVALNIVPGSGKEHMAVISALMKMGLGFRLVAVTKEGIKEL